MYHIQFVHRIADSEDGKNPVFQLLTPFGAVFYETDETGHMVPWETDVGSELLPHLADFSSRVPLLP